MVIRLNIKIKVTFFVVTVTKIRKIRIKNSSLTIKIGRGNLYFFGTNGFPVMLCLFG